jgi:hypothetical protein
MNRSILLLLSTMTSVVLLAPNVALAEELTVDEARAAFANAGFAVEPAVEWSWTSPSKATFRVHDPTSDGMLMVLVFPDAAAAQVEQARLQHWNRPLVPGYGPPIWRDNVALVQSSVRELVHQYALEQARAVGMSSYLSDEEQVPGSAVAAEFVRVLPGVDRVDL